MRVLVVEDSRGLADGIAEGLRDQGMAVDLAYDGRDAAAKLDLNAYEVVILDRDLPGLHGDTLCRMLAEGGNPAMVLMLTAAGSPGERVSGLSLGADDYLASPSISPSSSSESAPWPAASPPPGHGSSAPPAWSSTPWPTPPPATGGS